MSAFEDFVNLELPRRGTILTFEITGYTGDPNSGSAPSIVNLSPKGTFYLNSTDSTLWRKTTGSAGSWLLVQRDSTTAPVTIYVDPVSGNDNNNGASSITAFRSLQKALDQLPARIKHQVTINVAAGTLPDTSLNTSAFVCENAGVDIIGTTSDYTAPVGLSSGTFDASFTGQTLVESAVVTGAGWVTDQFQLTSGVWIQLTSGASSGQLYPIASNTATTIDLPTDVTVGTTFKSQTFKLVTHATVLNLSASTSSNLNARGIGNTGAVSTCLNFQKISFINSVSAFQQAENSSVRFTECMFNGGRNGGVLTGLQFSTTRLLRCMGRGTDFNQSFINSTGSVSCTNTVFHNGNLAISMTYPGVLTYSGIVDRFNAQVGAVVLNGCAGTLRGPLLVRNNPSPGAGVNVCSNGVLTLSSTSVGGIVFSGNAVAIWCGVPASSIADGGSRLKLVASLPSSTIVFDSNTLAIGVGHNSSVVYTPAFTGNPGVVTFSNNVLAFNMAYSGNMSGSNLVHVSPFLVMTGNTNDFTIDGTAYTSLTALRAAPNKTVIDLTRLNRLVEA